MSLSFNTCGQKPWFRLSQAWTIIDIFFKLNGSNVNYRSIDECGIINTTCFGFTSFCCVMVGVNIFACKMDNDDQNFVAFNFYLFLFEAYEKNPSKRDFWLDGWNKHILQLPPIPSLRITDTGKLSNDIVMFGIYRPGRVSTHSIPFGFSLLQCTEANKRS